MNAIKNYILNLDFVRQRIAERIAVNYESVSADIEKKAQRQVSELLGTTDEKNLITYNKDKGFIFIGGERITPEQCMNLKQEAEMIESTMLWKLMTSTVEISAQKRIFEQSETMEHILSGKMALYNLSLFKKFILIFKSYVAK